MIKIYVRLKNYFYLKATNLLYKINILTEHTIKNNTTNS